MKNVKLTGSQLDIKSAPMNELARAALIGSLLRGYFLKLDLPLLASSVTGVSLKTHIVRVRLNHTLAKMEMMSHGDSLLELINTRVQADTGGKFQKIHFRVG